MNTPRKAAFLLGRGIVLEALPVHERWTRRLTALEQRDRPHPITLRDLDRKRLTKPVRTTVAIMGTAGHLARLLNAPAGRVLVKVWKKLGWSGLGIYLSGQTASDLPVLGEHGLPKEKLKLPTSEVDPALWEIAFFQKATCDIAFCDHSRHWFVREDPRRSDCILHRLAGARRRYRASPAQQRERQRKASSKIPRRRHSKRAHRRPRPLAA
jgi:hypothetical protein